MFVFIQMSLNFAPSNPIDSKLKRDGGLVTSQAETVLKIVFGQQRF